MIHYRPPSVFNVYLKVRTKRANGENIAFHKWEDLTLQLLVRYDWYFKYRAALYQVKYPKAFVEYSRFKHEAKGNQLQIALRNRWIAKKRKVTEWTNRIARAEAEYNELFPIEEHKVYIKAVAKLAKLKLEFIEMNEKYMDSLTQ